MKYRIKNWAEFQHYKDRNPPWIKLYRELLNDPEWNALGGAVAKHLVMFWIVASENDGFLPDLKKLAFRCRIDEGEAEKSIRQLSHWLEPIEETAIEPKPQWPSRYVSGELKNQVLERDSAKCVYCESTEKLEIDHIIPVSKGGESILANLQVLCRSCNRKKRTRVATAARSVARSTHNNFLRTTETERESEKETETKKELAPKNGAVVHLPEVINPETPLQLLIKAWKLQTGVDPADRAWDAAHYKRHLRPAQSLLNLFSGDLGAAVDCIETVYRQLVEKKGLDLSLQGVVNNSGRFRQEWLERKSRLETGVM